MSHNRALEHLPAHWRESMAKTAFTCVVCSVHYPYADADYEESCRVCGSCAETVANLFWKKHGDGYLTWPNPAPARPVYVKKQIKTKLRLEVYERDGFKCVYCGARKDLTCDHVTPESKGGATEKGNLVTCCRSCNTKKKTKSLADFWAVRDV